MIQANTIIGILAAYLLFIACLVYVLLAGGNKRHEKGKSPISVSTCIIRTNGNLM